jgi:glycosyltransferase involved in cell wall biosynthesis
VLEQTYPDLEYIIINGGSDEATFNIVHSFGNRIAKFISEPDKGIYDAINKGISIATGDIIGILNADDFLYNGNVISEIVKTLQSEDNDAVYGDVEFIASDDSSKIKRYYSSKKFSSDKFRFGFMPAHPSFYVKRNLFDELGFYKTDYKIAADFELLLRFMLVNKIRCKYIEMPFVKMRTGGVSNRSVISNFTLNKEIARACRENGIKTNYLNIYSKYFVKVFEFFGNGSGPKIPPLALPGREA